MASTRTLVFILALLICILKPLSQYLVSPKQVNTFLILNLAFYKSKIINPDVFPAIGLTQRPSHKIRLPHPEFINEQQMVVLTEKNFSNFITKNQHVMVIFYSSQSYWRKRLSSESAAAAMKRQGNLVLAKVDADKEKLLAKKYMIGSYPTIYFFYYGLIDEFYADEQILLPANLEQIDFTAENDRLEDNVPRRSQKQSPGKINIGDMEINIPDQVSTVVVESFRPQSTEDVGLERVNLNFPETALNHDGLQIDKYYDKKIFELEHNDEVEFNAPQKEVQEPGKSDEKFLGRIDLDDQVGRMNISYLESTTLGKSFKQSTELTTLEDEKESKGLTDDDVKYIYRERIWSKIDGVDEEENFEEPATINGTTNINYSESMAVRKSFKQPTELTILEDEKFDELDR